MSFTARYRSECDECEDPIEPGDLIRSTGERTYAHVCCPGGESGTADPDVSRWEGTSDEEMGY